MAKADGQVVSFLVAILLLVSGCAAQRGDIELLSRGPQQQFDAAAITNYANNQELVYTQIRRLAGLAREPADAGDWRVFVIAGFDFADAQCEEYMGALRRLDVARRRTVQQTNLIGSATAGILGIAGAASAAIAITAIAFGLTAASIDNVSSGLLYELPPSTVRDLVMRTRGAYEEGLTPADWQDRPTSFRTIRGYVELCLPTVIETNATAAMRASEPRSARRLTNLGIGSPPRLQMSGPTPQPAGPAGGVAPGPLTARAPVTATTAPPSELAGGRQGADEEQLLRGDVRVIQAVLCMPPEKQVGNLGSETRAAITQFRQALGSQATGPLKKPEITTLLRPNETCDRTQYRNAFERFAYPTAAAVTTLQRSIGAALSDTTVPTNGVLNDATREAIKRLQKAKGLPETGEVTFALTEKMAI